MVVMIDSFGEMRQQTTDAARGHQEPSQGTVKGRQGPPEAAGGHHEPFRICQYFKMEVGQMGLVIHPEWA